MRLLTILLILLPFLAFPQVPQAFEFQGVARDNSGNALVSQAISLRLSIISGSPTGPVVYQETQSATTTPFGLFTVQIGSGTAVQGAFTAIAWAAGPFYLKVEFDPGGGSNFQDMGTTQFLSVPYAFVSGSSLNCFSVSLLGDTLYQGNGCYVIIPGISAANGGCADEDQDGFYDQAGCGTPIDCDDDDPSVAPDFTFYQDLDGDGFGTGAQIAEGCVPPPGFTTQNGDCDDLDPQVFPGQDCSQYCDASDQAWLDQNMQAYFEALSESFINCGFPTTQQGFQCIVDDLVNLGIPISPECHSCGIATMSCIMQNCVGQCLSSNELCYNCAGDNGCLVGFVLCAGLVDVDGDGWSAGSDCDDADPDTHPYAEEVCDGQDNDCDGQIDEGLDLQTDVNNCGACGVACGEGFTCTNGQCVPCTDNDQDGFTICDGDCDDSNAQIGPDSEDVCDGIDNNCNGIVDEFTDIFSDPQNCGGCGMVCPPGSVCSNGVCVVCNDNDQDGFTTCDGDCDDNDPAYNPGTFDDCNGNDNNCDGIIANNLDQDADGITSCGGDCNDFNSQIWPGATEFCDGLDNDCDGQIDEGGVCSSNCTDGILNGQETGVDCGGPDCLPCQNCFDNDADGFTTCNGDCDDSNFNIRPGAQELCNGIDDDCDGQIDEGACGSSCTDGVKNGNETAVDCGGSCPPCAAGEGCLTNNDCGPGLICQGGICVAAPCPPGMFDCDGQSFNGCEVDTQTDPQNCGGCGLVCSFPNAISGCTNGTCVIVSCLANYADCDGNIVNGCETYLPFNNSNCGACGNQCPVGTTCQNGTCITNCTDNDLDGFTTCNGDCNDANFQIRPGALEICNGIDDDCDGQIDEGLGTITCGTGACQNTVPACLNGVPQNCTIDPASAEICDGIDNDCDGSVDEGFSCSLPNATSACQAGNCVIVQCLTGFSDCDGSPANGCEVAGTCTP